MFRRQILDSAEDVLGVLFSAGFMVVWLFCWPLYRLYRSHSVRG